MQETVAQPPYVLIVGHGRSGTNWLLDICDASSATHCRNEPNEVEGAALEFVQELWYSSTALERVVAAWDRQVAYARISTSIRDHHIDTPKDHVYAFAQKTGLASFPVRPKARKVLGTFLPKFRLGEWTVPWWISNRYFLEQACTVFKINMLAAWFVNWHVLQYPERPVLHIVRHPGGYLNSSVNRFFSKRTSSELEQERQYYQAMLTTAGQISPRWQEILGDIQSMTLYESVLWFWRLNNEMIHEQSHSCSNYRLVIYEDIVRDPLALSRQIYDFCGLAWNEQVESRIISGLKTSVWGPLKNAPAETAKIWQKKLKPEQLELIEHVMTNSDINAWWSS